MQLVFWRHLLELLLAQLQLLTTEVSIGLTLHRDEVNMCVGHFQSQHHLSHLLTGERFLDSHGHALCKLLITSQFVVIHIEEIVHLTTGNDQCMALHQRIDIEESIELLVLCTLIAGNLTGSNLCENIHSSCRYYVITMIMQSKCSQCAA